MAETGKFPDRYDEAPFEEGYPLPEAEPQDDLPPGGGKLAVAPYLSFSQIVNYASRTYRWTHDEALRSNRNNALAIRRDPVVMDALRSRQIPTVQLPWHLECENDQDTKQAEAVGYLTDIINHIPRWQQFLMHLQEALWPGRSGVQIAYGWDWSIGKRRLLVRDFKPINGDKLVFKFSGATGLLVHATYPGTWQVTDRGRAHFFTPEEREQLVIHKFEPEDSDFFEPELGGSLHGVGIRGRIYWLWYLRSQVTAFLMDYLERVGAGGLTIYYYEAGNLKSLQEVQTAASVQWRNNAVLFPRYRQGEKGGPGVDIVQAGQAGAQLLQSLITDYYDRTIRRYINGEDAGDAAGSGLGSGISSYLEGEKGRRIKYDAVNLAETLTSDLVHVLQKYSPYAGLPPVKFVFDVDKPNAEELLGAAQAFFEMGGTIDEDQLRGIIGLEKPQPGHSMLAKMGAMSPAAAGSVPAGVPMLGQPGPEAQVDPSQLPPEAGGMPPAPMPGQPMQMARRGQRLRFSAEDLQAAVDKHFPGQQLGEPINNRRVIHTPEHKILIHYRPETNQVKLDFRRHVPGNNGTWSANDEMQPGSLGFSRDLLGFVRDLGTRGIGLQFSADNHHAKAYTNLLTRLGWTRKTRDPRKEITGSGMGWYEWEPPSQAKLAKVGRRLRYSREAIHAAIQEYFPDAVEHETSSPDSPVFDLPKHNKRVMVDYFPEDKLVGIDFRHISAPRGVGVWQPQKSVQSGSTDFVRQLTRFVRSIGKAGLGLTYSGDKHHTQSYRRLLKRMGWRPTHIDPKGPWYEDVWHPPEEKPLVRMARRVAARVRYAMPQAHKTLKAHSGVLEHANSYLQAHGMEPHEAESPYLPVDVERAKRIADYYHAADHNPHDQQTRRAYRALKRETLAQYRHLLQRGVKLEPWEQEGQPYQNSQQMAEDARNGHLHFFTGGDMPSSHHLAGDSGVLHRGRPLTFNDLFRAVHDYFGHALYGNQFGPQGEEHAYRVHSAMYSPLAQQAMATETRGQNSWVNFGPHIRRPDGSIPKAGEQDFQPQTNRPYAEQKNFILPPELRKP